MPDDVVTATAQASGVEPTSRLQRWKTRVLPWLSLAMSLASALEMNRSESRGGLVAAGAAASWVVFVVLTLVHKPRARSTAENSADRTGALHKILRFTSAAASQSLIQLPLFFSAPFYLQAAAFTPLQCAFAALFAGAVVIATWDPWCARALLHPWLGPVLLAFASFVGWNAALPMLGFPHGPAAWLAAGAVGLAIPTVHVLSGALGLRRLAALGVGLCVPLSLVAGAMRAVPAAPLRVMASGIGTQIQDRTLLDPRTALAHSPGALLCWTAIRAPHGLHDALVHVWALDGVELQRITLDVKGGRRAGFRTWSRAFVAPSARGVLTCSVETELGQPLARVPLVLGQN